MAALIDNSLATMIFSISWESHDVKHREQYHAADVNMWRDVFPNAIRHKLLRSHPGDTIQDSLLSDDIIDRDHSSPLSLPLSCWQPPVHSGPPGLPMPGRYYPQGFLQGVAGIYPQTITPMRVVEVNDKTFTVDMNHPLDGRQLDIKIEISEVLQTPKERGGRCSNRLGEILDDGPGLQARIKTSPITFDPETAYRRAAPDNDQEFYAEPRLVSHIDSRASRHLASLCGHMLSPGNKVLDLMASLDSHLPEDHGTAVTGLGMNRQEMDANKHLHDRLIFDLNEDPSLPFPDNSFDAVLCNLSIEYLVSPHEVLRDIARVLVPSGTLLMSFSNRWFPPKVIRLWTELHDFERMGYVLQLCWPYFDNLQTYSYRNWPRPTSDRHFPKLLTGDPLYVITGRVRS